MLAMTAAGDAGLFRGVAAKLTPTSDPVEDIHYLIVLARMTAPRTPAVTKIVADALVGLDQNSPIAISTATPIGRCGSPNCTPSWPIRTRN